MDATKAAEGAVTPRQPRSASAVLVLRNKSGLHARPAGAFTRVAKAFQSTIQVTHRDKTTDGKTMLGVLSLDAWQGAFITITATGDDAVAAIDALRDLIKSRFGESE
jgi:phosphocarrier protein